MPDGYRRGGHYRTRSGATAYRRGTRIKTGRRDLLVLGGVLVAATALTGGSLVGSPVLLAGILTAVVGVAVYRNRRRLRPVGRKLLRWADKHAASHPQKATLVARARTPR